MKKELAERRKKDLNDFKKLFDEEDRKEKERLALSRNWEFERRKRETQMLQDLEVLCRQTKIYEMNRYREHLDIQCVRDQQQKFKTIFCFNIIDICILYTIPTSC